MKQMSDKLNLRAQLESNKSLSNLSRSEQPEIWLATLNSHFDSNNIDRSFVSGFYAHNVGYAFSAGYQNAVNALFHNKTDDLVSFSMTENGSAHPKKIQTVFNPELNTLSGAKHFVALADNVQKLYVLARFQKSGPQDAESNIFRILAIPADLEGITIKQQPPLPIIPDIKQGYVRFENVAIKPEFILDSDAYHGYVEPFRTYEDIHVVSAILGLLYSTFLESSWPQQLGEDILSLHLDLKSIYALDLTAAKTHLELDRALNYFNQLVRVIERTWKQTQSADYKAWQRDKALLKLAEHARTKRKERAKALLSAA